MPRAEARTGDTRRDPRVLLAAATLLLLLRIGATVWEERHLPPGADGIGGAAPPVHFFFSGSAARHAP